MIREQPGFPSIESLREELAREEARYRARKVILNIVGALVVVAAITTLIATRVLIWLQVNGSSMDPTLRDGELVVLQQTQEIEAGDIIGFHYGGEVLLKRVIGCGGDRIEIDQKGNVSVNGKELEEPCLAEKSLGKCELSFPYQVPEGTHGNYALGR